MRLWLANLLLRTARWLVPPPPSPLQGSAFDSYLRNGKYAIPAPWKATKSELMAWHRGTEAKSKLAFFNAWFGWEVEMAISGKHCPDSRGTPWSNV